MIESSGPHCSVATARLGEGTWRLEATASSAAKAWPPMRHTAQLLPLIKEVIPAGGYARLRAVACSSGPGSYTALRAGLSSAKGICLALDKPLLQVSTLRGLAAAAAQKDSGDSFAAAAGGNILVAIPARRTEVYTAAYAPDLAEVSAPAVVTADEAWVEKVTRDGFWVVASPDEALLGRFDGSRIRLASTVLNASNLLAECVIRMKNSTYNDLASTVPLYLRPPFITRAKTRL